MTIINVPKANEDILSRLIDTYQKLIFSICYKITGDYFTAEDLAQETFITAYEKQWHLDNNYSAENSASLMSN